MNWKFQNDLILFETEQGLTVRKFKSREDDLICFTGGTLLLTEDGWYGGVDINYRRYFLRDAGVLIPKSYQYTNLSPYTFERVYDIVHIRLWEPYVYTMPYSSIVSISGVDYMLNRKHHSVKALSIIQAKSLKKYALL